MDPHPTHDSYGPSYPTTQTASLSLQPSLHRQPYSVPILYNGTPTLPKKFAPSHGGSGPPSNTWFPGPTQVLNPNGSSTGAAVFAGLTSVTCDKRTDRPTDHATWSVRIGRICVRSTAMRTNNNMQHIIIFCNNYLLLLPFMAITQDNLHYQHPS